MCRPNPSPGPRQSSSDASERASLVNRASMSAKPVSFLSGHSHSQSGRREESGGKEGVKGGELRAVVEGCSLCFQPPICIRILGSRIGNAKMRIKNVCTQLNRIDVFSGKKTWA